MHPRFILAMGTIGLAASLVAAPVGLRDNAASLSDKAAFAAGNGSGGASGGKGRDGRGHGRGHGSEEGLDNSLSALTDAPGKSASAPGRDGVGQGQQAQAFGHDAVSGVSTHSAHHQNAKSLEGNLNAAHASAQGFAHASSQSMVGAIRDAVQDSYVSGDDEDTVIDRDEIDLEALESALMGISKKDVDAETAEALAGEVDGKVSEPDAEAQ